MKPVVRCAIYTRQSVADDLEFNSLELQRQSCLAYIESQKGKGWTALSTRYDDHGVSGGTIDRPSFKRLLEDIEAGEINAVVVYRLDRLSRSAPISSPFRPPTYGYEPDIFTFRPAFFPRRRRLTVPGTTALAVAA